jgi:hypothetical protein
VPDLLSQALVLLNVVSVVGGLVYFVARMGSKLDALTDALNHLAKCHDDHEGRLRHLESVR